MRRLLPGMLRLSWPLQGLLLCALFLVVGLAVVDDYGAGWDGQAGRGLSEANLAFIRGDAATILPTDPFRFHGVAFELPLFLLERGLGLEDSHRIYLLRHLLTHLFFLAGGWCASLLAYRLFQSRGVALLVLVLFVLQPRLYAHSFFNSKDLPFLSMFMVSLYATHRAFRKETVGAFLLCGVCVGLLTNLRIMGVMLLPAVLGLRGLDVLYGSRAQRTQGWVTGAVFVGGCLGTLYGLSPYLWANPFEWGTAVRTLAHYPIVCRELFQGSVFPADQFPPHFLPTWLAISTPPVTLLLGILGATWVGGRSVRRAGEALRNTDLRFGLLLLACLTLPVVAVVVLGSHLCDAWRQMFFLHAPLCVLGGWGLRWIGERRPGVAVGGYALVGIGVLVTGGEMVRLHPHQQVYFNWLVDRTTPEYLRTQYEMDPRMDACREGLEFLRRRYPDTTVSVRDDWPARKAWFTLPRVDRFRLALVPNGSDFRIFCGKMLYQKEKDAFKNMVHIYKLYNNTLVTVGARPRSRCRSESGGLRVGPSRIGASGRASW